MRGDLGVETKVLVIVVVNVVIARIWKAGVEQKVDEDEDREVPGSLCCAAPKNYAASR